MKKTDYDSFIDVTNGGKPRSIDQLFEHRKNILQKYNSQYPFKGDGKLFHYKDWSTYEQTLPTTIKINLASNEEQKARNKIIDVISVQTTNFTNNLMREIPSASATLKENAVKLCTEVKSSATRLKNEGVSVATGNIIKSVSYSATPTINAQVSLLNFQWKNANQKTQKEVEAKVDAEIKKAKGKFAKAYDDIKKSIDSFKAQVASYSATVKEAGDKLLSAIAGATAYAQAQALLLQKTLNETLDSIQNGLVSVVSSALESIAGALGGLADLIKLPSGFSAVILTALGSRILTDDTRITGAGGKGCDYTGGVPDYDPPCPASGLEGRQYRAGDFHSNDGYKSICFTPKSQDSDEEVRRSEQDAKNFAESKNGYLYNDCEKDTFVVFWKDD
jgi:hypothetical protein